MISYMPLPKIDELDPGIEVCGFHVLILPREVAKQIGAIVLPDDARDREEEAGVEGLVVGMGEFSFHYEDAAGAFVPYRDRPDIGDAVMFARYAGGRNFDGADGRRYRIMLDKDILGIRRKDRLAAQEEQAA